MCSRRPGGLTKAAATRISLQVDAKHARSLAGRNEAMQVSTSLPRSVSRRPLVDASSGSKGTSDTFGNRTDGAHVHADEFCAWRRHAEHRRGRHSMNFSSCAGSHALERPALAVAASPPLHDGFCSSVVGISAAASSPAFLFIIRAAATTSRLFRFAENS